MCKSRETKAASGKTFRTFLGLLTLLSVLLTLPGASFAASVVLNWDPSTDADLAGYRVYYQANSASLPFAGAGAAEGASPIAEGNVTSTTITGLDPSNSYFFSVTAYNSAGLESAYSNIIEIKESVAPVTSVSSPASNASVRGIVQVSANASDNVGVTKVQFFINGSLAAETAVSPYAFSWDTSSLANGVYLLSTKAFDAAGNEGDSSNVAVTVAGDTIPPTVSVAGPANNATVKGSVVVSASANDNVAVTKLEIYLDGSLVLASNQNPVSYSWNTAAATDGGHILSAKAYDAAGNVGQSSNVAVNVLNDTVAPTVDSFSLPTAANSTSVAVVGFSASDNVGVAGYLITESATAPAANAAGWTPGAPASFTFAGTGARTAYAWAKDASGNVSVSRAVSVLIDTTLPAIKSISIGRGGATLTINAAATDNVVVAKLQLYIDNSLQQESLSGSLSYVWTVTYKGTHTITVKAYDSVGNVRSQSLSVNK